MYFRLYCSASFMQIVIDPSSRILYASYYIQGLYEVFGKKQVKFSSRPFQTLQRSKDDFSFEHFFAFVIVKPNGRKIQIVVDFCDPPDIHPQAYAWCDTYAKINFNELETPAEFLVKIRHISPGFGIKIWNLRKLFFTVFQNYFKSKARSLVTVKRFFKDYKSQYERRKIEDYKPKNLAERQTE